MRPFEYSEAVLDHYENPRNVGEAAGANASATVESDDGRDRLTLTLRIEDGIIREARFRTFGCVAAIAASSRATEMLQGIDVQTAAAITDQRVAAELGGLPPSKIHCSVLAGQAIRTALASHQGAPVETGGAATRRSHTEITE